jgi:Raf kinase inhibitor-like YbhB/YbcL family protein
MPRVTMRILGPALAAPMLAACSGAGAATTSMSTQPATRAPLPPAGVHLPSASPKESDMRIPDSSERFTLTSPEFADGAEIPRRYTCEGDDVSPALSWSGAPGDAMALALIVDDPDASGFVHWVVFDMTASATGSLSAGWSKSPDAPPQGTNGFGRVGYGGPCPPSGTHRYVFRLLALGEALALSGAPTARQVLDAAAGHILGEASLTGTYARGG